MTSKTPHGIQYEGYRPVVMGRNGMVCSGHPLASQAGMQILQKGGNAIDAAIAVGACLNVVEPMMSGIGGDGFIMVYMKDSDELRVINASGKSPMAATREMYLASGIPHKGINSVLVPGLLAGWYEAHKRFGLLPWSQVLDPSIELAECGFPISNILSNAISEDNLLCSFPTSKDIFTRNGTPLQPGEILYQKDLARTFRLISEEGPETFYSGEIGSKIATFSNEQGGILSLQDLRDHQILWQDPISTTYRDYVVYEAPPNSSGHVLLQELNLAETFDIKNMGLNTMESIHMMVEAKKLAFADREAYMADPDFVDIPIDGLLSKEYARERAKQIDPERAAFNVTCGSPWKFQKGLNPPRSIKSVGIPLEDTTCFVVVDRWGNSVSQLQSLQSAFGSSLVARDTGILLNNRMSYWLLGKDHVDVLEPGKRVRHTMNPVMVFKKASNKGRKLVLVCGTPGADTQVQTNFQVISHVLDFGMNVVEAVEAPRWRSLQDGTESNYPHRVPDQLLLERRYSDDIRNALMIKGHEVKVIGDWAATGSEMMIYVDQETGALHGGADPRRDGYAIGW